MQNNRKKLDVGKNIINNIFENRILPKHLVLRFCGSNVEIITEQKDVGNSNSIYKSK